MNYDIIINSTNAICRYAKTNDPRLNKAIETFYTEGIKSPSVAKHLGGITYAKYLADEVTYLKDPVNILSQGVKNIFQQVKALLAILKRCKEATQKDPQLSTLQKMFEEELNRLYPKKAKMREKVIMNQIKAIYKNLVK